MKILIVAWIFNILSIIFMGLGLYFRSNIVAFSIFWVLAFIMVNVPKWFLGVKCSK